ncbi:MAG TPA: flagellar hook-associated protein FlgK [Noviherbaspirillum sp.]|jgi:flagellar hook-associated protein 1 FlgK|uniref:flagellar hook-associated protein FlgK n=1 Tax=Noviherbaspirillum sp. TaxID=1926288 RepID=UPI002F9390B6
MSSILGIGKSALAAAQAGLATAGHNIANAATPGYSRQVVVQASAGSQNMGGGFVGKGTQVADVRRVYNELLAGNVRSAQSTQSQIQAYYTQLNRINNQLADSAGGLSPALQEFFKNVGSLASHPDTAEARQGVLSTAQTLAARFQALDGQMREVADGVNGQIETSVQTINTYAEQIAKLNDAIEKAQGSGDGKASNDLLDQRDYAISELSKEIKTSIVKQGNSYNIFIGNGQPLVVGTNVYDLAAVASANDPSRLGVGYMMNGKLNELAESSIAGGKLGGLIEFRAKSLDPAINALGRVAIGLAATFNAQHKLGIDQTGAAAGNFFKQPQVEAEAHRNNFKAPAAKFEINITDPSALTIDDYQLQDNGGGSFTVTNLTTGVKTTGSFAVATAAIKGVTIEAADPPTTAGDRFLIRPTRNGASHFGVAVTNTEQIAASAAVTGKVPTTNAGNATMSPVTVTSSLLMQGSPLTLNFAAVPAPGALSGFPADQPISVFDGTTTTVYPPGTDSVPYDTNYRVTVGGVALSGIPTTPGAHTIDRPYGTLTFNSNNLRGFPDNSTITIKHADGTPDTVIDNVTNLTDVPYKPGDTFSFGGISFTMTGTPQNGDKFELNQNVAGSGDNRNAVALGALQTTKTMLNGSATYQGAYSQLVSSVGNKARELEVTNAAETKYLAQAETAMQAESGVNLDEEAADLMRYQQAYQAAARLMQTASQLFDMLLTMGG